MLAELAVKRWQLTLVAFVALIALGAGAFVTIPKAEDPTFPMARFAIVAVLPGAAPLELERQVVDPIEGKLSALDDVKELKSSIADGLAVLEIEFSAGVDPDRKHDVVLREIAAVRPELPPELVRLDVQQFSAAQVNVVEFALVSENASYRELERAARQLERRIEGVHGVDEVHVAGLPKQEVRVALDLERMIGLGISPQLVMDAIGRESTSLPAGSVEQGARRFNLKTSGDYASVDEVRATVVRSAAGGVILLRDIAEVALVDEEASELARFNGKRAVLVVANQRSGENIFDVTRGIDRAADAFEPQLPKQIALARGFRQADNVAHRLDGFTRDFGLAIVLVLATLLPLGLRAALVVMVSIPLSLALGLVTLQLTGFTLNQLSVVGFVIALGLLVDDSVVVVENIARHLREGKSPRAAAIGATRQITASVLGCTATLMFAFLPLLALPGTSGQFIRALPAAVLFTIFASLLVSLTVVPFLASVLLRGESEHGNIFFRLLTRGIERSYRPVLDRALAHPALTLITAALLFAGSVALVPRIGFSLFPKAGTPQFIVRIEASEGASMAETERAARFAEATLARHPEVRDVASVIGKGHPQIYYNVAQAAERANLAELFAAADVASPEARAQLYAALRAELADYAGATIELKEFEQGPPLDAPIAIRVLGEEQRALDAAALEVERILESSGGTRDVRNPSRARRTDLKLAIDRDRAALLGVAVPDVDRAVRLALGGVVAGRYRDDGAEDPYAIRVTLPRAGQERASLALLERVHVASGLGAALPLSSVAKLALEPSPTQLRHFNKERSVTVTSQVQDGFNTDRVTREALARLSQVELGKGVRVEVAGEVESRQESFGGLGGALLLAAFGVMAILVLEFRTFKSTLIVASVIPLGVIGGLVALFLSGYTLSFTAVIGFIALMGIEIKNSILLVDFTNELRRDGLGLDQAIQRAGEARFVPILLTSLTAIGGLIPLVLERSSLYSPLALVILGGLVSSTILTRVVTPVLYKLFAPEIARDDEARPRAREQNEEEPVAAAQPAGAAQLSFEP
jgi:multidrug efflux pump subunit AcrB